MVVGLTLHVLHQADERHGKNYARLLLEQPAVENTVHFWEHGSSQYEVLNVNAVVGRTHSPRRMCASAAEYHATTNHKA